MINVYGREAQFLLEEGASVEEVNQALYDFGMPMGPLAMYDLVGNDVMRDIADVSGAPAGARRPLVLPLLCAQGRLGQKTGKGWSQYDENSQALARSRSSRPHRIGSPHRRHRTPHHLARRNRRPLHSSASQ